MQPRRLSILGVGLLGGSLGLTVRSRISGCTVVGYSHRPETIEAALAMGALNQAYDTPGAAVQGADLVVLCTPVGMLAPILKEIAGELSDGAIVTDVGSTKQTVVEAAERLLRPSVRFVGSHPMAGSEKRGVRFARADLFDGAVCITTPTARTHPAATQQVEDLWKILGMRVTRLEPAEHDRLLADVSHLPHAIASALVAMQDERALSICGKGFLDLTRIAAGDPGLWRDILLDNAPNVRQSIRRLTEQLGTLESLLAAGEPGPLEAWLEAAARRRSAL